MKIVYNGIWAVGFSPVEKNDAHDLKSVPVLLRKRFLNITALTDKACREYLDEEYQELCREMTAAICRKRHSPIENGRAESWAFPGKVSLNN